jgi:aryl-alcohol dehydrogenase-like predicted oxidoreductase
MNIKQRFVGNTELKIDILGLGCAPLGGNFVDLSYEVGTKIIYDTNNMYFLQKLVEF